MSRNSIPISAALRCVLFAIAAMWIASIPPACAQTSSDSQPVSVMANPPWQVTITAPNSGSKLRYAVYPPADTSKCIPANPNPTPSAENLYVCVGDTVNWVGADPSNKGAMFLLHLDPIVLDSATHVPVSTFATPIGKPVGGVMADIKGQHKYIVNIYDTGSHKSYPDDPKIIIGGGQVVKWDTQIDEIINELADLNRKAKNDAAKDLIRKIIDDLKILKSNGNTP